MDVVRHDPAEVLDFWFPDSGHEADPETHGAFWQVRMQGGMDADICARFAGLTEAAARGRLDHWAGTPRGRLALLIALDQFPRSLWRDTPAAFAQDIKAARLALEGIESGDYDVLAPWEQTFFVIAITHCEGRTTWRGWTARSSWPKESPRGCRPRSPRCATPWSSRRAACAT